MQAYPLFKRGMANPSLLIQNKCINDSLAYRSFEVYFIQGKKGLIKFFEMNLIYNPYKYLRLKK